jgi:hypothetical protein
VLDTSAWSTRVDKQYDAATLHSCTDRSRVDLGMMQPAESLAGKDDLRESGRQGRYLYGRSRVERLRSHFLTTLRPYVADKHCCIQ